MYNMGTNSMSKMVLLSTLAALVIIVHSAEEDYEAQYRRELMSRKLDTGTPRTFEQPWRTMELEPAVKQSTPDDTLLINSSEEPPRRRRLGRKRKRRPEPSSSEDLVPSDRYGYPEEQIRPYLDVDSNSDRKMANAPKKRRNKLEPSPETWDSATEERRVRRRGQKRNRHSQLKTWPEFSEISNDRSEELARDINEHEKNPSTILQDYRPIDEHDNIRAHFTELDDYNKPQGEDIEVKPYRAQSDASERLRDETTYSQTDLGDEESQYRTMPTEIMDDKSVSEISNENFTSEIPKNDKSYMKYQTKDNLPESFNGLDRSKNEGPLDPQTLKEILKRSNGTSLSEILQQHNLTLTDLLHGKEEVLSILKSEDLPASTNSAEKKSIVEISTEEIKSNIDELSVNSETKYEIDNSEHPVTTETIQNIDEVMNTEVEIEPKARRSQVEEGSKRPNIRKFSTATRRKLRIRPMMNTTYKSQLSRDMIALNARKYFNNRRRNSSQEWKDHLPMMKKNLSNADINKTEIQTTTLTYSIEETTIKELDNCSKAADAEDEHNNASESFDVIDVVNPQNKTETRKVVNIMQSSVNITESPIMQSTTDSTTQTVNASGLRRQAFNNRLKKKRLKQKNLTTEPPQDDIMMNLFGIPNLVSSSEFIARTEEPKSSLDDVTFLEDFMTTHTPQNQESRTTAKYSSPRTQSTPQFVFMPVSTEETAKIEIEEIFNDTQTSARLSKILKERNMTLSELVEHRERGSSHVHLADIFHNASKEPNPPEPFLSKSLLEPISKETYPLRALLDVNNHDTTAKATTIDPVTVAASTEVNIPVIMDFGNNVNENAENMGIMSLFHNITKNGTITENTILRKDSQGTLYETSITVVNTTDDDGRKENNTFRESRVIHDSNDNQDDIVRWNEIFSLMRKNYENQTEDLLKSTENGLIPAEKIKKPALEEDLDDDNVIVLEDFQHLKDFDSSVASESKEKLEFNTYERAETPTTKVPSVLDTIPNQTKSVTVATASIAGLAMVLFLLTYVGYRWQQQRSVTHNKSFPDEHVPTPVFENRKGHKHNSSSRSISPMLSSNIYTLNTLDSRNGKESPDYMWDSLRKPFQ